MKTQKYLALALFLLALFGLANAEPIREVGSPLEDTTPRSFLGGVVTLAPKQSLFFLGLVVLVFAAWYYENQDERVGAVLGVVGAIITFTQIGAVLP